MSLANWFSHPDLVGGWKQQHQNQNGNKYQLDGSVLNNPIVHPLPLQIGGPYQQTWVMGMVPVGYDISDINYDGKLIFQQNLGEYQTLLPPGPISDHFRLGKSRLGGAPLG